MGEERRVVTVLFADLAESTALAETLDPEDLRAVLARYYEIARQVAREHDGTIEKFIGDAVVMLFGLPVAHGDDAQRGLSAALALRDAIRDDADLGSRLRPRFGVSTGEVVGPVEPHARDFLATGDAFNIAARLQEAAQPWSILCSDRTVRASGGAFAFGPSRPIEARGRRERIVAANLLSRARVRAHAPGRFVGRNAELAELDAIARRAFAERRAAAVTIVAPPGIGKSRLAEELAKLTPSRAPDAVVVSTQCLPYGQRLTFWPMRAVLLRLTGARDDDSPDGVRAATVRWLSAVGVRDPERTAMLLAATVGLAAGEVADPLALADAWREALEAEAARHPLALFIEDLHWSSDSLLDLVERLLRPPLSAPLLVVALARPELLQRRASWAASTPDHTLLSLAPLPDAALVEYVGDVLGDAPAAVIAPIVARSGGNPFFAGELARALRERVEQLRDVAAAERALTALPDSVQGTILARLDLLPPDARRAAQLGAVVGRSFRTDAIAALAPDLAPRLGQALDVLVDKEIASATDERTFAFRHVLIRDVAYRVLPRTERASLHAATARWFETQAVDREDALADLVAEHYREAAVLARSSATADARELSRKAVDWLSRAADTALGAAANVEAVRYLRSAIELAPRERHADLFERIGDAFASPEAADAYRSALALSRELGGPVDQQLRLVAGVLHVLLRSGQLAMPSRADSEEVERLRQEGRALLDRVRDDRAIARFLAAESFHPFWTRYALSRNPTPDDLSAAETSARRALEIAERLDDARLASAALDGVGAVQSFRGRHHEARAIALQRARMGDRLDAAERLDAFTVAAWESVWLGELDEAIDVSERGLAAVRAAQAPAWALHLVAWRALALMLRGEWDAALAAGSRARQLWLESGQLPARYALQGFIAALAVSRARRDDASREDLEHVVGAITRSLTSQSQRSLDFMSASPAELDHHLRFLDQRAPTTVELALAFASDAGRPAPVRLLERLLASETYRAYPLVEAEARRALGLQRRSTADLEAALARFERHGATPSAARARCELALITGDASELARGTRELERIGDLVQIERYRAAAAVRAERTTS